MKIHVYLLCYNEEKIISNIIDYYKQFASKIFILDNHSTDRSVEIANNYECVSIIPWKNESDKIDEAKYVQLKTQLYKNYSRKDGKFTEEVADWIISCDMDEVLYHPNIKDLLEGYTRDGVSVPKVTGFDMVGDNELDANLPIVDQYRLAERNKNFDKRIVFKASFDMAYSYGCHPKGDGFEYMKSSYGYVTSKESELALLHYKKIGSRYLEAAKKNAARLNMSKIQRDGEYFKGPGAHYLNIVNKCSETNISIKAKPLFDSSGNVIFEEFEPSSGEKGVYANPKKGIYIEDDDLALLFSLYKSLDESSEWNNALKGILLQVRPNHPLLNKGK